MAQLLRYNTTITVKIGPFLDMTNGVTEETGLAGTMTVYLSKNGATFAVRSSATAITHDTGRSGWYAVELNGTDTQSVGRLVLTVQDSATHLPVWHEYEVLPQVVFDAFVAGTSYFGANVMQWNNVGVVSFGASGGPLALGTGAGQINPSSGAVPVSDKTGFSLATTQTFNNTGTWTGNLTGNVSGNVTGTVGSVVATVDADVREWLGTGVTAGAVPAAAAGELNGLPTCATIAGKVNSNVTYWKGATAPDPATVSQVAAAVTSTGNPIALDASGYVTAAAISNGAISAATIATGAIDADALATDAVTEIWSGDPTRIQKNTNFDNFEFVMYSSSDHVTPATGLTVAPTRSIDGGTFASGTLPTPTEVATASGIYKINIPAADLNGNCITFKFTSATADPRIITIITRD